MEQKKNAYRRDGMTMHSARQASYTILLELRA